MKPSLSKRTYEYLDSLNDNDLKNVPGKNILTFHDTKVLVIMIYLGLIVYVFNTLLEYQDFISLKTMIHLHYLQKFILGDLILSFVHPIFIIRKTKKYLPQLWSDSNEVETMLFKNNDFYAWPTTGNILPPGREMSVRPQTNQETLRRNLNESAASAAASAQHPFAVIAPEY